MKNKLLIAALIMWLSAPILSYAQTTNSTFDTGRTSSNNYETSGMNNYGVNDLLVYPNPATSNARIVLNTLPASKVYVDVIDMNGFVASSQQYAPGTYNIDVDMSTLPQGLYSVRVSGKDISFHNLMVVKQ